MCPKYSIGDIGLRNGPTCLILGQIQAHIPIGFYQVYYQKMISVTINSVLFISAWKIQYFYIVKTI